jgi:hypothetical protein
MASQGLEKLIDRALADEAFAARLRTDLDAVMAEFNLTAEEKTALASGDPARMQALGVDQRISKAFGGGGKY